MSQPLSIAQRGFSLVEIMVAMVLGLVLLGGTLSIFASSKDSYRLQDNVGGLQENARYAIAALRRDAEMAGFPRVMGITPFDAATTDDGPNDRITLRRQSATDCTGSATPAGLAVNRYYINRENKLLCLGNGNPVAQPLVENIAGMQALYGLDDDGDGAANRYVTASEVNNGVISVGTPDWDNVVSLRVALLVGTQSAVSATTNPTGANAPAGAGAKPYTLLDAAPISKNDGRLYRIVTTTIPLRNRIP